MSAVPQYQLFFRVLQRLDRCRHDRRRRGRALARSSGRAHLRRRIDVPRPQVADRWHFLMCRQSRPIRCSFHHDRRRAASVFSAHATAIARPIAWTVSSGEIFFVK